MNGNFVPKLNRVDGKLSAVGWYKKVNGCAVMYDWDGKVSMYFAICKLCRNTRLCYDGLHDPCVSWEFLCEFSKEQFLEIISFTKLLYEAVLYRTQPRQDP